MEKIKCLVLDDDLAYCERVSSYVNKHNQLELAGKFTEPEKARNFLMENPVSLVFIDMEMPGINGITFLRTLSCQPYAIIISGYPDFALKAFEVEANDFVLKPFDSERFYITVNRAIRHFEMKSKASTSEYTSAETSSRSTGELSKIITEADDHFFVRCEQNFIKFCYKDVLYIKAFADFVQIYCKDKDKPTLALANLKQFESNLSPCVFIRSHKSYLVNMNHITSLSGDFIMLGGVMIPIGSSFKDDIMKRVINKKLIRR